MATKTKKPHIFITRPIPQNGIDMLKKKYRVTLRKTDSPISRRDLIAGVKNADALLPILTDTIDSVLLDKAPKLRVVANYAVGFDNIDVEAATERGIVVTNTPGTLDDAVAEHAIGLMLAVGRRIVEADTFTRKHKYKAWMPMGFMGVQLRGKTLGIIGAGRIGSMIAQSARDGFGMNVLYNDVQRNRELEKSTKATFVTKTQLLKRSDIVSLHVPLIPQTRHLIGAPELKQMKKTAILVNTSRGPVVAEKALAAALQRKQIFGAALDVFECEPLIDCDPRDRLELAKMDNVVLTPHIASATAEAREAMSRLAAEGIIGTLSNKKPKNIVNSQVWRTRRT